ncbi:MAG: alpha/beta fold hydrolase [Bacteroidota bacterium]|nr:alpha/beta fold hydrolase [Bacteroidota bacterium]
MVRPVPGSRSFIFASMQKSVVRKIRKWIRIILVVYIACGITLYFIQERFLFHPQKLSEDYVFHFTTPYKEINLPLNNETNLSIVQFTVPDSICKGVVLYFHGNRQNIEHYAPFVSNFTKNNYEVWMMDYPGFGKSTGERTESVFYEDALQLYKMARARFAKDSIVIYGKSIGTGVAAQLASVRDCKRLILETPYYSIDALFRHYAFIYPVSWMCKFHFPVYQYMEKVDAPITLFHGTRDEVIPFGQSGWLMNLPKNVFRSGRELVVIKNGKHNNLDDFPLFHEKLDSVLQLP